MISGNNYKWPDQKNCKINDFDKCTLRKTIQYFYLENKKN